MCIIRVQKSIISKMVSYNYRDKNPSPLCALGSILNMLCRKINKNESLLCKFLDFHKVYIFWYKKIPYLRILKRCTFSIVFFSLSYPQILAYENTKVYIWRFSIHQHAYLVKYLQNWTAWHCKVECFTVLLF